MNLSKWGTGLLLVALLAAVPVRAEDAKDDAKPKEDVKPTVADKKPAPKPAKPLKLTKPWSELKDLTDEQKTKIAEIHHKALEETKAIEAKEKEDILALLNADEKAEVEKAGEKKTMDKKKDESKKDDAKKEEVKKEDAKPADDKAL